LFYEQVPVGTPPLLLVHRVGCDHSLMAPQPIREIGYVFEPGTEEPD
jgi:hypothetical protein